MIQTDVQSNPGQHNIQETKSILIAFAENKLTGKFPDNIDDLDLMIAFSLAEKEIRVRNGTRAGGKHQVKFSDIRRVKCISNGTLRNLYIYTRDKGGFFDVPDMNASFFANEDGSITEDWHKIAYDQIRYYQSDINIAENAEGE